MPTTRRDDRKLNQRKTASILLVYVILRPRRCLPNTGRVDTSELRAILRPHRCPPNTGCVDTSELRAILRPHRCLLNTGRARSFALRGRLHLH
jgi:hypothetical protein